jgi:hypothetical protein
MSVEYRLYYDKHGYPITYLCVFDSIEPTDIDGKYIVVDQFEYLCRNHSVKVINGKIVSLEEATVQLRFKPNRLGTKCAKQDISIIVDDDYKHITRWGTDNMTDDSSDIIDIADLDCIYLSYDEPQKEEFWLKIKNMVPWAKRVDGVKGSDAAHKAAAEASDTERFILIDGDNMPNESFFNMQLDFTDKDPVYKQAQFRWRAVNSVNGLRYGNGGMSSWTKTYVREMKTHEHSDGNDTTTVDFCLNSADNLYWAMYDCYSTTYPNYTPFQAWRAGFREGVKMCLVGGKRPSVDEFKQSVASRNLNNLTIWHNVGADVENGEWAILGARLGTYMTMLTNWNPQDVQWFDNFIVMWDEYKDKDPEREATLLGEALSDKLGLPMCTLSSEQSKFFKRHYNADKHNLGPLEREMDVIRRIEGW